MADSTMEGLRSDLLERKAQLLKVADEPLLREQVEDLIHLVDTTLDKMQNGNFGVCEVCHGHVEEDRLHVDPLIRFCLECLNEQQQRELEQDLELASSIQHKLLPEQRIIQDGWSVAYHYQPAGIVSGDYCDLIPVPDGSNDSYFIVGDVSGKGVSASMLMSQLHAIFHSLTALNLPVSELIERANRLFCECTRSIHYSTLVFGRASASGHIELVNAGHWPPVLVHQGKCHSLAATGLPLGLFCGGHFDVLEFDFEPGDSLLLYTDGLNESLCGEEEYGTDRILSVVAEHHDLQPTQLIEQVIADLSTFTAGAERTDDLTIMAIRRN